MMKFSLTQAMEIAKRYQFLIGHKMDDSMDLTVKAVFVCPCPSNENKHYSKCITLFIQSGLQEYALANSGFVKDELTVLVLSNRYRQTGHLHSDLDAFLTRHNIAKDYSTSQNYLNS